MCGRYALIHMPEIVRAYFGYLEQPNFPARYNIAPTQPIPVVTQQTSGRHFTLMRWGFVPGFVKDLKDFPLVINIRSETVREKPSFRAAFQRRRCLLPVDGFYEWQRLGRESRPFLLRRPDRGIFAFAGLFETWSSPDGSEIDTAALLNTSANGVIAAIHERSPVILDPRVFDAWLDPATAPERAHTLLQPPPDDFLELVAVSKAINKVANDGPHVQEAPADESPAVGSPAVAPKPPKKKPEKPAPRQGRLF
jgi:putative SOS response-associated peptidase YedK